jgi:hypothetical protein
MLAYACPCFSDNVSPSIYLQENDHDPVFETKFVVELHPDTALSWRVFDDSDPETVNTLLRKLTVILLPF